jgi:cell wall assembly regulator SMI1
MDPITGKIPVGKALRQLLGVLLALGGAVLGFRLGLDWAAEQKWPNELVVLVSIVPFITAVAGMLAGLLAFGCLMAIWQVVRLALWLRRRVRTRPVRAAWKRIEARLAVGDPAVCLRRGASKQEIAYTESFLGVALPEDWRESLRCHDGQEPGTPGFIAGWELLPLERVRHEWAVWKALLNAGDFADLQGDLEGQVVADWWHPRWIPLTCSPSGDHHCLDFQPGPLGRPGQIIELRHDDAARPVVAPTFQDWLTGLANGAIQNRVSSD